MGGMISVGQDNTVRIGHPEGSNYVEFDENGTMTLYGTSTVWDDIQEGVVNRQLASPSGKLVYNWSNGTITQSNGGSVSTDADCLIFNLQLKHTVKPTSIKLHIHWEQSFSGQVDWDIQYRIQKQGEAKTVSWSSASADSVSDSAFTYVSGTLNQITSLVNVDISSCDISDIIQFRLARTDAITGDIEITFIDAHMEIWKLGSDGEYTQ